jgi:hypothetical protein
VPEGQELQMEDPELEECLPLGQEAQSEDDVEPVLPLCVPAGQDVQKEDVEPDLYLPAGQSWQLPLEERVLPGPQLVGHGRQKLSVIVEDEDAEITLEVAGSVSDQEISLSQLPPPAVDV